MIVWKIAWHNLLSHKGKSLIVGVILFFGTLLMTVGNAILEGAREGLEENMLRSFTGHLILTASDEETENVFFQTMASPMSIISNYPDIQQVLQRQEIIESFVPMTRGYARVLHGENITNPNFIFEETRPMLVFGVNFEEYQQSFHNNVVAVEGELLKSGERGVLFGEESRENLYKKYKIWVLPQESPLKEDSLPPQDQAEKTDLELRGDLVLLGLSGSSFANDIRLPVKGVVRFQRMNVVWDSVSFMDIESFRKCFDLFTTPDSAIELTNEQKAIIAMDDAENLFTESDSVQEEDLSTVRYDTEIIQQYTRRSNKEINLDNGVYNFILVILKPGVLLEDGAKQVNQALIEAGFDLKVKTWREVCSFVAGISDIAQGALFMFVNAIFFVGIMVIMNTLSIAAIERTSEIGMMRAIGASKGFITRMFLAEITFLSCIFGILGIVAGNIVAWGLTGFPLPARGSRTLPLLVGGDYLHPSMDLMGISIVVGQLAIVTLLAALYPIWVTRTITPLDAISRD